MDLQQLRIATTVESTGSISAAARALFMGQPNVSKTIKDMEAEAGFAIFMRTRKGVVPTTRGREFLQHAHNVLLQVDTLSAFLHKDIPTSSLHLAAPGAEYLYDCFARYLGAATALTQEITYKESSNDDIVESVSTGEADLGVLHCNIQEVGEITEQCRLHSLQATPLWLFRRVLLLAENHPLVQEDEIPFSALSPYPEIQWVQSTFHTDAPHTVITVPHPTNAYALLRNVRGSYMWSCPIPAARAEALHILQRSCGQAPCVQAFVVQHTARDINRPAQDFLQLLHATVQGLPQGEL